MTGNGKPQKPNRDTLNRTLFVTLEHLLSVKKMNANLYLKDDEFAFENSEEVTRLLSHDHPDLHRRSIVLVINVHSLVGAGCDLVFSGVTALVGNIKK